MSTWAQLLGSAGLASLFGGVAAWLVARTGKQAQVETAVVASRGDIEAGAFVRASEFTEKLIQQQADTIGRLDQRVIAQQAHIDEQDKLIAEQGRQLAAQEVQLGAQARQLEAQDGELVRLRQHLATAEETLRLRYPDEH